MKLLAALDHSDFSMWLLQSNSIWAYPTVLTLHTFGMMVLVGSCAVVDLRLLGFGRGIPLGSMQTLFRVMWGGFWINLVTGSMLFVADATKRATQPLFMVKLSLIAVGIVTIVMIRRNLYGATPNPVTVSAKARGLALVSLLAWCAAITAGRLLAYIT